MQDYNLPDIDGLFLRSLQSAGSTEPVLRLDLDRGTEAIYIYFYRASPPDGNTSDSDFSKKVQTFIDDAVPHLKEAKECCEGYEMAKKKPGLREFVSLLLRNSARSVSRRAIKSKCQDLNKLAQLHSGSGFKVDINYQLEVHQS